jgi:hypothetical protein
VQDRFWLYFGLLVSGLVLADLVLNGGAALLFLAKKLMDLIETVAVWR